MIDVKELRVGNWIVAKSGRQVQVLEIYSTRVMIPAHPDLRILHQLSAPIESIQPIPITEDVLFACGAKMQDGEYFLPPIGEKSWSMRIRKWGDGTFFWLMDYYTKINIDSLHQLQNLIFALTNQELIYTP